jgi:hypothetical protein
MIHKLYNTGSLLYLKYCQLLSVCSLTSQSVVIYIWWLWYTNSAVQIMKQDWMSVLVLHRAYDGETNIALFLFCNRYTKSQNNRQWSAENPIYFMKAITSYIRCMVWYECKKDQRVSLSMCTCPIIKDHIPFPARHCNNSDQKQFCVLFW